MRTTEEKIDIEYFKRKFAEAKKEYDLLGAAVYELMEEKTKTLDEIIKKAYKLDKLKGKRLSLLDQQLKRGKEEMEYRERNGLPPLTKLRELEDLGDEDE